MFRGIPAPRLVGASPCRRLLTAQGRQKDGMDLSLQRPRKCHAWAAATRGPRQGGTERGARPSGSGGHGPAAGGNRAGM